MGIGEVIAGELPAAREPGGAGAEPARAVEAAPAPPPGEPLLSAGWTVPRRTRIAIRAAAAAGCALTAGVVAAFVAPPLVAAAIGALIGLFCHLGMGERARG